MCTSPIMLRLDYTGDKSYDFCKVPCGKCLECKSVRSAVWIFRNKQELKASISSFFVTLTYDDENLPKIGVCKDELQRFFKRLRKEIDKSGKGKQVRYFACAEYGDLLGRPHYHVLLYFNFPISNIHIDKLLGKCWKLGIYKIGKISDDSIAYTTKYMLKDDKDYIKIGLNKPFQLMSRRPALGSSFLTQSMRKYISDGHFNFIDDRGKQRPIPRYYIDKCMPEDKKLQHRYDYMEQFYNDTNDTFFEYVHRFKVIPNWLVPQFLEYVSKLEQEKDYKKLKELKNKVLQQTKRI